MQYCKHRAIKKHYLFSCIVQPAHYLFHAIQSFLSTHQHLKVFPAKQITLKENEIADNDQFLIGYPIRIKRQMNLVSTQLSFYIGYNLQVPISNLLKLYTKLYTNIATWQLIHTCSLSKRNGYFSFIFFKEWCPSLIIFLRYERGPRRLVY